MSENNGSVEKDSLLPRTSEVVEDGVDRKRVFCQRRTCWISLLFGLVALVLAQRSIRHFREDHHTGANRPVETKDKPWWQNGKSVDEKTVALSVDDVTKHAAGSSLRWGILGLGRIARDFTTALLMAGCNVTAVAAGTLPETTRRAKSFAANYGVPTYHGSYEELAANPDVDIVYVATIHPLHKENTLLMLRAGKNVVVEKPMAMDLGEATEMANEAKLQNRLLLTNFWTRFFPIIKHSRAIVQDKSIGSLMAMRGDFAFPALPDPNDRYMNRTMGGGAMLDLGCYLVNLAVMAAGAINASYPAEIQATGLFGGVNNSVDTEVGFAIRWGSSPPGNADFAEVGGAGQISEFRELSSMIMSGQVSFRRASSFEVEMTGDLGRTVIHKPANAPYSATIFHNNRFGPVNSIDNVKSERLVFDERYGPEQYPEGAGFMHVIRAVERCMAEKGIPGQVESGCVELDELPMEEQLMTVSITEDIMRTIGYWKDL